MVRGHDLAKITWDSTGRSLARMIIEAQAPLVTWACTNDHVAIIRLLISQRPYSLDDAAFSCNLKLFDMLLKEYTAEHEVSKDLANQAFRTAVIRVNLDIVDQLLSTQVIDLEAPIMYKGFGNALKLARIEQTHLLGSLFANGAVKDMLGTAVEAIYQDWLEEPSVPIRWFRLELVGKSIAAKVNLNAVGRKTGKTALQLPAGMCQLELVDVLLSAGADLEAKSWTGEGPLHILSAGVLDAISSTGKGPLHIVLKRISSKC